MRSKRCKFVPEYCETYLSHLPVNSRRENIQSLVAKEVKTLAQQHNENVVREKMRRTVTSKDRPSAFGNFNAFYSLREAVGVTVEKIMREDLFFISFNQYHFLKTLKKILNFRLLFSELVRGTV